MSRPMKFCIHNQIILKKDSIFDYGCGRGGDINRLRELGYEANGFDPYYARENPLIYSDVVTCLFVLDVIEEHSDRIAVLRKIWHLSRKLLVIAVRQDGDIRTKGTALNDGYIRLRTFQRGWHQPEFRKFVEETLNQKTYLLGDGMIALTKNLDFVHSFKDRRNVTISKIVRHTPF